VWTADSVQITQGEKDGVNHKALTGPSEEYSLAARRGGYSGHSATGDYSWLATRVTLGLRF